MFKLLQKMLCAAGMPHLLLLIAALCVPWAMQAQVSLPYTTGFETDDDANWTFVNDANNAWYIGTATSNSGSSALYVSNNSGTSNAYTVSGIQFSYAYRSFTLTSDGQVAVSFDWKANGESSYDYLRAWIAPDTVTLTAGYDPEGGTSTYNYRTSTPDGWTDLGGKMNLVTSWQTTTATATLPAGNYRLVFLWANDNTSGSQPPAAVDNVAISVLTCPAPTDLTATISATQIDFSWLAGGSESSWKVSINGNESIVNTNSYSATNLTSNTLYNFKVYAICGNNDTSFATQGDFRTSCLPISSLPYINGFEDDPYYLSGVTTYADAFPYCWTRINDNTGTSNYYPYLSTTSSYVHSGNVGMYWYHTTASSTSYAANQYAVLPPIDPTAIDISDLTLSFYAKTTSSSYHPQPIVGVMSDPDDVNTFSPVYSFNSTEITTSWNMFVVNFEDYVGTGTYIAIKWPNPDAYWYLAIDDIYLTDEWCDAPTGLAATATNNSITLSWNGNGASSFQVILGDDTISNVTDTFYTFNNLTAATLYNYSVATQCATSTSLYLYGSIRTDCDPLTSLPYSYGFDDATSGTAAQFPTCWRRINDATGTYNYYPYVSNSASYVHSGSNGLYWYHSTSTDYANNQYAVLPGIDLNVYSMSDLTLTFYAKTTGASYHPQPIVGVMENSSDPATFTPVYTFTATEITNDWNLFSVSFADYQGDGSFIAIKWPRPSSTSYLVIDDIYLTDEFCDFPTNVTASSTSSSVTISWNANGGSSFTVVLGDDTITGVTTTSYTFNNLTANTPYNYAVATECTSSLSTFIGGSVRTACEAFQVPYSENFDSLSSGNPPFCYTKIGNGLANVFSSSTYSHSGSMSVRFSGATTDNILVLPLFDEPTNNLMLTVWTRPESYTNSSCGSFQLGYITDLNNPASFVAIDSYSYSDFSSVEERTVMFANAPANARMALRHTAGSSSWYWFVDDILVEALPSCPSITNLATDITTPGAAIVSWDYLRGTDSEPTGFEVSIDTIGGTNPSVVTTSDLYIAFTGLTAASTYEVNVRAVCGGSFGQSASLTFNTASLGCLTPDTSIHDTITIGNATTTSTYLPSYSFYNYGLSQQIYTADELNGSKVITGIAVMPQTITQQRTYEIYLAHTPATGFSGSYLHPSDMMKVKNATPINLVADQWIYFNFDTTFAYNGSDNLLVCFRDMTGTYVSGNAFYAHSHNLNSLYSYQDGSAYDPFTQSTGTSTSYRNNMRFLGSGCSESASCANPAVFVSNVDTAEIEISWIPGYGENSWDVDYRLDGASTWTSLLTATSLTSYTVTGLNPGATYEFRVSHDCDNVTYSATTRGTTNCVPAPVPFSVNFDSWSTGTSGTLPSVCWTRGTNYSSTSYYPYVSNSYSLSGGNSLYLYSTSSSYSYLALPLLEPELDSLMVSFWMMKSNTSYAHSAQVGVMTDANDISTFVPIATVECSDLYEWEYFDVSLANYHGQGRIAFKSPDGVYSYPYIDDITVDYIPSCPRVTDVNVSYASNDTLVLSWTPGNEEEAWEITYDSVVLYADADSILIDQLVPNTLYNFSIRAICGDEDTSLATHFRTYSACGLIRNFPFTEDFEGVAPGSSSTSSPFGLTCWRRLNNGTTYGGYPYVSYSSSYNHTEEGTRGLYWYAYTTTGTYGDYMTLVLPEVDTTVAPLNSLMFTFWAKPSSTSYQPVFYVGTMSDQDDISTFVYYDTIVVNYTSTDWMRYTVMLDRLSDTIHHSYVALRANRPVNYWYAYVDDISLDIIPDCSPVEDITVTAGPTSAMVQWTSFGTSYQGAIVEYKEATSSSWSSISVSNANYAAISGLTPNTVYDIRVYAVCDDGNATGVVSDFTTASFGCAEFDSTSLLNVTIGNGATTNSYIPSTSFYNYGYSQQFFKGSEIGGSGVITSITLTPSAVVMQRTYEIYMGTSTDTAAASFITPNNMTCVYNGGPVALNAGQPVTFNLTTPFNFVNSNGNNLVVIFRDLTGSYVSGNVWEGDDAWTNASRYVYQDAGAYTPGSVTGGTASSFRNKISFFGGTCLQASTCAAPPTIVTDVTSSTIDLAWTPGNTETAWNVYYRPKSVSSFTLAASNVNTTSYQLTGLNGGTKYVVMVVPVCVDSMSTSLEVTTECAAISQLPYYENFDNWGVGTNQLPSCWSRNGTYSTYTYISGSYNHGSGSGGAIYMYQGSSDSYTSRIILPMLDTTVYQANQTQLVFSVYYGSTSYNPAHFEVGVTDDPDDPSSFVPVDTVFHSGASVSSWETLEASLANYTGNGAYVTVKTFFTSGYDYPYIDDFYLELIPTCPRPDSLRTNGSTTNSVDLAWHERGNANSWIIEYGPLGFDLGTGTTVLANSNPFTLTGLPSSYIGEYYVRALCGGGDTGEYSRTSCMFSTSQIPGTIPYTYDFENAAEWDNWQTSSNVATDWYRGNAVSNTGAYSMYISADQGATYTPYQFNSVVNAAAYRDIDFGSIDSSFTVSFDARVGGSEDASYDGLMVFLIDPSIPAIASNSNITSPWGNVNDLYRIATVRLDTTWNTYTASFDTIHGIKRVAFFWFNQNTGASHPTRLEPAAVDNISIDYSTCARPVALAANPSSTSADLSWHGSASLSYEVVYRPYGTSASNNVHLIANTNHLTIGGLNMLNEYIFWVRKYCGAGDTSLWSDGYIFKTTYCTAPDTIAFGDSTSTTGTSYNYPVNNYYRYTLCEIIIDSAELGDNTIFDAIAFSYNAANPSTVKEDVDIYIMPTTATTFTGTSDIQMLDSTAVLVYSGSLNCQQGWNMFGFIQPYIWDGQSNLMLVIDDNSNDYDGSTYTFDTRSCNGTKTITYYSDSYDPDPFTITSSYSGSKTSYQYRPEMMLLNCASSCSAPNALAANNITYHSATLNWSSSATEFELSYKAATDATWPAEVSVSDVYTFDVDNLAPATQYQFRVRAICDSDEELISDWTEGTFVTDSLPCFVPTDLHTTALGYTTATLAWSADASQNQWSIRVWTPANGTDFEVTSNPFTVTGLAAQTTYYAAIKAVCGGGYTESEYSDTIEFTTETCTQVTGVTVSQITANSAVVTWNAVSAVKYEIEYGDRNFNQGTGTTIVVNQGTSYTLTGLLPDYDYSVFVRAYCEENVDGAWSDQVDFTTPHGEGFDSQLPTANGQLSIYPNPTTDATTIAINGVTGEVEITIVDMNGRTVATETMSCNGDCTKRMEVSTLAQGAYFIRINGDSINAVKKLIVK